MRDDSSQYYPDASNGEGEVLINLRIPQSSLMKLWDMAELGPKFNPYSFTEDEFKLALELIDNRMKAPIEGVKIVQTKKLPVAGGHGSSGTPMLHPARPSNPSHGGGLYGERPLKPVVVSSNGSHGSQNHLPVELISAPALHQPMTSEGEPLPGYGKRVLIVDDLGVVVYQLKRKLIRMGYTVDSSNGINEAMELFTENDYHFIIMDLLLPSENDGFSLLDNIVKLSRLCQIDSQVVVMSASAKKEYRDRVLSSGASLFVEKGMDWYDKIIGYLSMGKLAKTGTYC